MRSNHTPARQVVLLVQPYVHALDLSGPVQVFHEAGGFSAGYRLRYVGMMGMVRTAQGMTLANLEEPFAVSENDLLLVPGVESATLDRPAPIPIDWIRKAHEAGATVGSICTGAFALARAGLLDGRECTTHWKVVDKLRSEFPQARVLENRLFVRDGRVVTSAGVASGIDMALALVEDHYGAAVAARVAREMVIYLRRDGTSRQSSIYLEHRAHMHPGVHRVQDWLVAHADGSPTIADLSRMAGMSPRNLTRVFRAATGVTLKTYMTRLRLERAASLLRASDLSVEGIASEVGFRDARQLRRLFRCRLGTNPSEWRRREWRTDHS